MRQTLAIFIDAYRELNSKKLFWIALGISLAVVIALALPVQTDKGIGIFGAKLESGPFQLLGGRAISASAFYKFIYSWIGINLWLGWGATILALISTASMIPDLVSSGSIELTLAKPIGRLRLFITKFVAGLAFVGLQAGVFAVGAIIVIGVRSSVWDARPLLVVPIMMTFFSFLHCISVLVGLTTRSTLMSLISVLLVWLFIWALGSVENIFLQQKAQQEQVVARLEDQQKGFRTAIDTIDSQLRQAPASGADPSSPSKESAGSNGVVLPTPGQPPASASSASGTPPEPPPPPPNEGRRGQRRGITNALKANQRMLDAVFDRDPASLRQRKEMLEGRIKELDTQVATENDSLATTRRVHFWLYTTFTVFPKTGETKDLFQRWVIDKSDWQGFLKMLDEFSGGDGGAVGQEAMNKRPLWWILGTSFGFEAVILGIATIIFVRRDF